MTTLINHGGAVEVTLEQLKAEPPPVALTETHYPMHHGQYVDLVKSVASNVGMEIISEELSLRKGPAATDPNGRTASRGYDDLFGVLGIKSEVSGQNHALGIRGSNTMNFSRQLGAGNHVLVCDNMCFSAQVVVGRKHTLNLEVELPELMREAIQKVTCLFDYDAIRTDVYRESRINDRNAHDVMMRSIQGGSRDHRTPASKLEAWVSEWQEPKHVDFKPRNAWSLLNAHTEVAKAWNFDSMSKRTEKVQGILDDSLGLHSKATQRLSDRYTAEQIDECQIAFAA